MITASLMLRRARSARCRLRGNTRVGCVPMALSRVGVRTCLYCVTCRRRALSALSQLLVGSPVGCAPTGLSRVGAKMQSTVTRLMLRRALSAQWHPVCGTCAGCARTGRSLAGDITIRTWADTIVDPCLMLRRARSARLPLVIITRVVCVPTRVLPVGGGTSPGRQKTRRQVNTRLFRPLGVVLVRCAWTEVRSVGV